MADIYGSTLDTLMSGRINQQRADTEAQSAYRNYLATIANTNLRRLGQEAEARAREKELELKGRDLESIARQREGQLGLGMMEAQTRAEELPLRERLATMQAGLAREQMYTPPPVSPSAAAESAARAALLMGQAKAAERGIVPAEVQALRVSEENTRRQAEEAAYADTVNQLYNQFQTETESGGGWRPNSPDTKRILGMTEKGSPLADAISTIAREKFAMKFPRSSMFSSDISAIRQAPGGLNLMTNTVPVLTNVPASRTNAPIGSFFKQ